MGDSSHQRRATFGQLVESRRKELGLSRRELADKVGYDGPNGGITISKIERGVMRASDERLRQLGVALGIPRKIIDQYIEGTSGNPLTAAQAQRRNQERALKLQQRAKLLQDEAKPYYEPLEMARQRMEKGFLAPFLDYVGTLDGASEEITKALAVLAAVEATAGSSDINEQLTLQRARISGSLTVALAGGTALGFAGGGAVGAGVAAGAYAAVGAFASASTGTAIASLSGAAASSATLAWLGGGSMAAGGLGVAGGTAALAGIIAAPAALAAGVVLFRISHRMQRRAQDDRERLDLAEQMFDDSAERIRRSFPWTRKALSFLSAAELTIDVVNEQLGWSVDRYSAPKSWTAMTPGQRSAVARGVQVSSVVLSVLPLPVLANPTDEELTDDAIALLETQTERWNEAVLADARACLTRIMANEVAPTG